MPKPLHRVVKTYPRRGPVQQFRVEAPVSFVCFRCQRAKKSRLLSIYGDDWERILCNGCYGELLSLYEVAAGTDPDETKAAQFAELLTRLISHEEARRGLVLSKIAADRASLLSPQSQRFLGTSEFIARSLAGRTDLDWSAAIIGLCKSVETEFLARLIEPLREAAVASSVEQDARDPQLGRIASYCSGSHQTPPELGAVRMLLATASHSTDRLHRSPILQALKAQLGEWPYSGWLISDDGAAPALEELTTAYRNRAAHLGELNSEDYERCFQFVVGETGVLWNLIAATRSRREVQASEQNLRSS